MVEPAVAHVLVLLGSTAMTATLAVFTGRRLQEPGAVPFVGLMVATSIWSGAYAVGLVTHQPGPRLLLEATQWLAIPFVPVCFVLFALAYTGNDEFVSRHGIAALCVLPVATVVLVWTNPLHHLVWTRNEVAVTAGLALARQQFGPWFWVTMLYTYVLIGVGGFLLVRLAVVSDHLYADQSVLLGVGVLVPVLANVASVVGLTPYVGIDLVPYALAVTGLTFGYALYRYRLFELVPATRSIGRRAAIADLEDAVVIVDRWREIAYLNRAAADIFDCGRADALGRRIESLLDPDVVDADAPVEFEREDRTYEVSTSPVFDHHGRTLGHTYLARDVTARKDRERTVREQRDELATLDRINAVIRGVNRALVGATTRKEMETAVCEHLASSGLYRGARVGRGLPSVPSGVSWTAAAGELGTDPRHSVQPVSTDGGEGDDLVSVTVDRTTTPRVTIPIVHGQSTYGVLVLHSEREDAFGSRELAVLQELGEILGHATNAIKHTRLLVADGVVEIELTCVERAVLARATDRTDATLRLEGIVPVEDGRCLVYVAVEDASADAVLPVLEDVPSVEGASSAGEREGGDLVAATVAGRSPIVTLVDRGARVTEVTATAGECRVVAEVSPDVDVGALVAAVREAVGNVDLVARRELDRRVSRPSADHPDLVEDLSARQRQVVEAAYRAGYFEWPRENTGEDVADSVDLSAPTFYKHLRRAQEKLFSTTFDGEKD